MRALSSWRCRARCRYRRDGSRVDVIGYGSVVGRRCNCGEDFDADNDDEVPRWAKHLFHLVARLTEGIELMSDQQSQIDQDVQRIDADVTSLAAEIQAELDAVAAANPAVDLSGLNAAVAKLDTLNTANAPAAPAPGAATTTDAAPASTPSDSAPTG